ncbi:PREDICTED: uncharacterized protein LOC109149286 [Ipomoea nil]|uniref:uncharacterized protein LOC109149286 n=1 Tax=Ipomoea nil TaxID=35883 RepID=UPI0009010F7C|nr:PREDICTED: uncharacterized protein LOC109149286 [Ipomoea nil]
MNTLKPILHCKCDPRCKFDLIDQIRSERDTDQVIRFLQGLNDDYNGLKSNVLVLDPLPEVYRVFVMVEKLERQITMNNLTLGSIDVSNANVVGNTHDSDELVATSLNSYKGKRSGNAKAKCTFCGMTGHTVDKCYKKHSYPPGWKPEFKSKAAVIGDLGISSEQMQKIISIFHPQANQSPSSNTSVAVSLVPNFKEMQSDNKGNYPITLVNSFSMCESSWILDSGATNHIEKNGVMGGIAKEDRGLYLLMKSPRLHFNKSEAMQLVNKFHSFVLSQFGVLIKVIRGDNGSEFNMTDFFSEKGVIHQRSCVHTPQQNAIVERKH